MASGGGKTTIARILIGKDRESEVLEYRPAVDTLVSLKEKWSIIK